MSACSAQFHNRRQFPLAAVFAALAFFCAAGLFRTHAIAQDTAGERSSFLVDVPLPLVGSRDELVERQVMQIISQTRADESAPIVILKFTAAPVSGTSGDRAENISTRGSKYERALALARFLSGPSTGRLRLVAYVGETVEGHAVLPVLACDAIVAAEAAELGRAGVDESFVDDTMRASYLNIAKSSGTIPEAAVEAMLSPDVEVVPVNLVGGESLTVTGKRAKELTDEGKLLSQNTAIWSGGSLAAFNGARMRNLLWTEASVKTIDMLPEALNIRTRPKTVKVRPEKWNAVVVRIAERLDSNQVSQITRAVQERKERDHINLVLIRLKSVKCSLDTALLLAGYLSRLDDDGTATAAVIEETVDSPAVLIAAACETAVALPNVEFGPDPRKAGIGKPLSKNEAAQRTLLELDKTCGRPAGLMAAAVDASSPLKIYVHQKTGKRSPMVPWQVELLPDRNDWLAKEGLVDGGLIAQETARRYGLIDEIVDNDQAALTALGLESEPPVLEGPWVESAIRRLLANEWLPRLLFTVGFIAIMMELGSPGLGAGGFIAAVCFVAFFWIEMLQGNVQWLEVLLFVGGMTSLAVEIFILPGFGLFGIGGLVMVFTSIVLASQTFVLPSNSAQLSIIANNLFWVAVSTLIVMVGLVTMRKQIENTPLFRWVSLQPAGTEDIEELEQREAIVHWEHLLGQDGLTTTRLNPAGKAQFGRQIVNVLGTHLISEGVPVRVVEVRGNSIFVEQLE